MKNKIENNKCLAAGCNCESISTAQKQWGEKEIIGFCKKHSPKWLLEISIGEYSPGIKGIPNSGGRYKKVS